MQDSKIDLKYMYIKMLEKTLHFFNVDLVGDSPTLDIPRFHKIHKNATVPETLFNLQPATFIEKIRRHKNFL